jgi:hypothetical protein
MPESWTTRSERHYEQTSSAQRQGSEARTRTMAARGENGLRREDASSVNRRTAGTGNPRAPLEERSKDELYNLAEQRGVKGRSRMNKMQLITAIKRSVRDNSR